MSFYNFNQLLIKNGFKHIKMYSKIDVWEKNGKQVSFPIMDVVPRAIYRTILEK